MLASIEALTNVLLRRRRLRLDVFFVRMWFFSEWFRLTLFDPVSLKRLAAPRCDFNFGTILTSAAPRGPLRNVGGGVRARHKRPLVILHEPCRAGGSYSSDSWPRASVIAYENSTGGIDPVRKPLPWNDEGLKSWVVSW